MTPMATPAFAPFDRPEDVVDDMARVWNWASVWLEVGLRPKTIPDVQSF